MGLYELLLLGRGELVLIPVQSVWQTRGSGGIEHNCTPRCSLEVSASGLSWLKHFKVQCYTEVRALLVEFRKTKFTASYIATRPEVYKALEIRVLCYLKWKALEFSFVAF